MLRPAEVSNLEKLLRRKSFLSSLGIEIAVTLYCGKYRLRSIFDFVFHKNYKVEAKHIRGTRIFRLMMS